MSDPAHTRLGESLKGLADSGLATVQTRLELFSVELKEEKLRAGSFLFDSVLAALFIGFGFVFKKETQRQKERHRRRKNKKENRR